MSSVLDLARADYLTLLRQGWVHRDELESQNDEWRKEIRRQARFDRLRVRTFELPPLSRVCAVLPDWQMTDDEYEEAVRRIREESGFGFLNE